LLPPLNIVRLLVSRGLLGYLHTASVLTVKSVRSSWIGIRGAQLQAFAEDTAMSGSQRFTTMLPTTRAAGASR